MKTIPRSFTNTEVGSRTGDTINIMKQLFAPLIVLLFSYVNVIANDYPYPPYNEGKMDPQLKGWPLTKDERAYIIDKPEHERRPGREANKHLPHLWPIIPAAGHWGGTSWLDTHEKLVEYVTANPGPCDVLLVGDSITQQWGSPLDKGALNEAWKYHFPTYKTINLGIGGDKTQNVLWRMDHGGVDGLDPRAIVLMIGNNNMFFTPETGIEPVAKGVQMCVSNLRNKFPEAELIVVKILPCHSPGEKFYEDIKRTNSAIDALKMHADPKVKVLDVTSDFINSDGTLTKELFTPDNIHLSLDGYSLYAKKLQPLLDSVLEGKGSGSEVVIPSPKNKTNPPASHIPSPPKNMEPSAPIPFSDNLLQPSRKTADGKSLIYPYAPYNEGKLDPQLTGWPLTDAELAWVNKGEYFRKPGHESQKHLPEMWFVTPAAARWGNDGEENSWLANHAAGLAKVRMMSDGIDIVLIGDSITQGWGGGWDGSPFNQAWQRYFGGLKTVNLGIGGDRIENILWRLDHGALDGVSPRVIVLLIGVNNAPLVQANGVPVTTAAHGIKLCIENLRLRCPQSQIVLVKLLPAFDPSREVGAKVRQINDMLNLMKLDADPKVHLLDLWKDFTIADGTLRTVLYSDKHLHLSPAGYDVFATKLQPLVDDLLNP